MRILSYLYITVFFYFNFRNDNVNCFTPDEFSRISDAIGLMSRDVENFPGPIAFGHKYITGGAGEGAQQLRPESDYRQREEVKSDAVLPAYCEPPNPCPLGYSAPDGCLEEFENSADFSRNYQSSQNCRCDHEHMFTCPPKRDDDDLDESLESLLEEQGFHKNLIAKKFHGSNNQIKSRRKRSVHQGLRESIHNPYLKGEALRTVVKKNGRNLH